MKNEDTAKLARWIVQRGNDNGDWACVECHPNSEILKDGFRCAYHLAVTIDAARGVQPAAKEGQ